jgi:hypothetical protein
MGIRQDIRNCAALAHLEACKQLGEQVTFYERGAAGVSVWAMPKGAGVNEEERLKVRSERLASGFSIARQTNFPPTNGPSINSEIVDADGVRWRIIAFEADSVDAVYRFDCERIKGKAI